MGSQFRRTDKKIRSIVPSCSQKEIRRWGKSLEEKRKKPKEMQPSKVKYQP
jgi:hypothetical protein